MLERLSGIEQRHQELDHLLTLPEVIGDIDRLSALAQERSQIDEIVATFREYRRIEKEYDETLQLAADDADETMRELARGEADALRDRLDNLTEQLKIALLPKDPQDEKNVIMEIRAGTGGQEAAIFAGDLFRMYQRYAERHRWGIDVVNAHEGEIGGFKEIVFEVQGRGAYSRLKYESGVHRVQRVPQTEASGRIHTSTATVAVLPEVEDVDVQINPADLRIDIFHSGGAGGQNVNKVATAVRLTHLPSGLVVVCQDERSQHKNRDKALAVLRARLYEQEQQKQNAALTQTRRSQVGSGERAEKIRTYNYPEDRVTDHRVGLKLHNLLGVLDGDLDRIIDAVATDEQARRLESA
ncbi:MAG TPA: peptide chain release factor 1 [Dehalococcoidia bacterium]|nr:peptide chain release factor 1 [Dehalococcoidia bacterium]